MPDYALYSVKVSLLTPMHIGSGRDLWHEYDYAVLNGQTWRINEAAVLDTQNVTDPAIADRLARTPPAQLLKKPGDFRPESGFFRYVIKGTPRSEAAGAQLREQIKDTFDARKGIKTHHATVVVGLDEIQINRCPEGH